MSHALELTDDTKVMVEYAFGLGRKVMPFGEYAFGKLHPETKDYLAKQLRSRGRAEQCGDIGDVLTIASLLPPSFGHVRTR